MWLNSSICFSTIQLLDNLMCRLYLSSQLGSCLYLQLQLPNFFVLLFDLFDNLIGINRFT